MMLFMELFEEPRSLGKYLMNLKERNHITAPEKRECCRQIIAGLEYLHTRDPPVVHRDLKVTYLMIFISSG
jgi:serine/threonine protein kinase